MRMYHFWTAVSAPPTAEVNKRKANTVMSDDAPFLFIMLNPFFDVTRESRSPLLSLGLIQGAS